MLAAFRSAGLAGRAGARVSPSRPHVPGDGKYADTVLAGIRLEVTDRAAYDPPAAAVYLLAAVLGRHRETFQWIPRHIDRLAGTTSLALALDAGDRSRAGSSESWAPGRRAFLARRKAALLYPE